MSLFTTIFVTQNRPKNSPITYKAHYAPLFLELLLNIFALKDILQKYIAIGCKRTKGIGIGAAQRWRRSFISGAYEVSNCLMFLKRSFGTPFCSFQKVSKDAMKRYYITGYGNQNRMNPKMAQKQHTDLITHTIRHRTSFFFLFLLVFFLLGSNSCTAIKNKRCHCPTFGDKKH